jgi:hypothetical protein
MARQAAGPASDHWMIRKRPEDAPGNRFKFTITYLAMPSEPGRMNLK